MMPLLKMAWSTSTRMAPRIDLCLRWVRGLWVGGLLWFWAIWPKVPTPPQGVGGGGGVRNLDGEWSQKVAKISGQCGKKWQ